MDDCVVQHSGQLAATEITSRNRKINCNRVRELVIVIHRCLASVCFDLGQTTAEEIPLGGKPTWSNEPDHQERPQTVCRTRRDRHGKSTP
jgi:hypothetical protein